jgi:orotidine-5'-phosphate decarboxylase
VTIHCDEGEGLFRDMAENNPGGTRILAVTLLTSLDQGKLKTLGYAEAYTGDLSSLVISRARMARDAGCHGIVCSGQEVAMVKEAMGGDLLVVTPGIRPAWSVVDRDDQKRIVTPAEAVRNGADYIVVGRPIRNAENPSDAAKKVAEEIESAM